MRLVIQRVTKASVSVAGKEVAAIGQGLLLLVGITDEDTPADAEWLAAKVAALRIFSDAEGKMNWSLRDVEGQALVVSQFTLFAKTKKGTRPSFIHAAAPQLAEQLYLHFAQALQTTLGREVGLGSFGAHMEVSLLNDGPVTILMDTKNKE